MKPETFPGVDVVLGAPENWDESKHGECEGLPIMKRDGICISCWSMTWRERFSILFGQRIMVHVASGETQPPIALLVEEK